MPLSYATMEKQMSSIPLTMVEPMPGEGVKQIQQKKRCTILNKLLLFDQTEWIVLTGAEGINEHRSKYIQPNTVQTSMHTHQECF